MTEGTAGVVMRSPTPRASESIRQFLDIFLARIVSAFQEADDEALSTNPPTEQQPETHQQRLLRELENERQNSEFLEQILMEKEFDEGTPIEGVF